MRTCALAFLMTCSLLTTLTAQHSDWLPEGSVLYYANIPWFEYEPVEIAIVEVIASYQTDTSEIRFLIGSCKGCESLQWSQGHLERVSNLVYYVRAVDSSRYLLYNFQAGIGDTIRHIGALNSSEPEFSECIITAIDSIALWDTVVARRHIQYTGMDPWNYMFYGPIIDEVSSMDCLVPQFGACDPGAGPLIAYRHPARGFHCFKPELCGLILSEFDYSPFPGLEERFYQINQPFITPIYGIGFESLEVSFDTLTLFPNVSLSDSLDFTDPKSNICFARDGGWMFHSVDILPEGKVIFYTGNEWQRLAVPGGDQILIETRAEVDDTWVAMSTWHVDGFPLEITARVAEEFEMEVLGKMDTIKRIVFSSETTEAYDSLYLLLGKNSGLVNTINFRQFSRYDDLYFINPYDFQGNYPLVGKERSTTGSHNLTWLRAWNFQVGDVIHTSSYSKPDWMENLETKRDVIWKILEKQQFHPEGITYTIDQYTRTTVRDSGVSVVLAHDTITETFLPDEQFDKVPGTIVVYHEGLNYSQQGRFNNRDTKCFDETRGFGGNSECIGFVDVDGCLDCIKYIEGLGGGYFYCRGILGDIDSKTLVYYKKGNEEWGTPFDFIVGVESVQQSDDIRAYPNPADKTLNVHIVGNGPYTIQIIDMNGVLRMSVKFQAQHVTFDVSQLSDGMYFIRAVENNGQNYTSRCIVQH